MYPRFISVLTILFLSGCAGINGERLSKASSDILTRSGEVVSEIVTPSEEKPEKQDSYQQERQALFDQPYIDPLTDYLKERGGDTDRAPVLQQVSNERDRRCRVVAGNYAAKPATQQNLARYRAGYNYSCPADVEAFASRVDDNQKKKINRPEPAIVTEDNKGVSDPEKVFEQSLSDCYLLTSIRNYSAAREACLEFAENGDSQAQANMAMIAHAFEDYASALQWARKAALVSGNASYLLGQMYASGRGVEQDSEQAVYWYQKAASQGHKEARTALDRYRENPAAGGT